jgi:hypothetical protein
MYRDRYRKPEPGLGALQIIHLALKIAAGAYWLAFGGRRGLEPITK